MRRNGASFIVPQAKNKFLEEFLSGIKKRRKTLKYKASKIVCERLIVEMDGNRLEKVEFEFNPLYSESGRCPLQFDVWEDRWIDLSFSEWKRGRWTWAWNHEGIVHPNFNGGLLIKYIELTIACAFEMTEVNTKKFEKIWRPILVRKPESV